MPEELLRDGTGGHLPVAPRQNISRLTKELAIMANYGMSPNRLAEFLRQQGVEEDVMVQTVMEFHRAYPGMRTYFMHGALLMEVPDDQDDCG